MSMLEATLIGMSLRHGILGLLAEHPASGYDLLATFHESLANVWPATQSQLYGELNKLAKDGLIEVSATGARGRKEYTLTEAGAAELHRWMVDVEPTRVTRNDMLLRVFFLGRLSRSEARTFLERERAGTEKYARHLQSIKESVDWDMGGDLATYGRIALEWGLRFAEMQRAWAEWALERIDADR